MGPSSSNQATMQAANEPVQGSPNRFYTDINRDNIAAKIQTVVMTELGAYYPLPQSLVNAHIGIRHNPTLAPNGRLWPDCIFLPVEASINMLSQIIQKRMGSFKSIDAQSPEGIDALVTVPSMCACLLPWSKLGTVIHSGSHLKFDEKLLDTPTANLKELPQWSIFIDLSERNLIWNDRKVTGAFYSRYALSKPLPPNVKANPNEEQFLIDNMISVIVFDNGSLDLGPFVTLNEGKTVGQFIDESKDKLIDNKDMVLNSGRYTEEQLNQLIDATLAHSRAIFLPLLHLMANLEKLADKNGRKQPLVPNPKPVIMGSGLDLPDASIIREYYLK